jgi:hypothetical protein
MLSTVLPSHVSFVFYASPPPTPTHRPEKNTDHYIIGKPLASRLWVSSVGFCLSWTKEIAWHGTQRRPPRVMTQSPRRDKSDDDCLSTCTVQVACNWAAPARTDGADFPMTEQTTSHPIPPLAKLGRTPIMSNTLAFDLIGQAGMPCSTRGWSKYCTT